MIGDKIKSNNGFTIIELLVAMSIFVLIVSSSVGLFVSGLKIQRTSIAYQQLLDQTSYLLEYMSRAVRMARKDMSAGVGSPADGACTLTAKLNYAFTADDQCLRFRNYKDQCQRFCLSGTSLLNENGINLLSGDLSVLSFNVTLTGQSQSDNEQPKVTFYIDMRGKEDSQITIQTAVSQRNLDVKR